MQVVVKGKNIDVTEALREHANQKTAKLEKLGLDLIEVEVRLGVEKNPKIKANQVAELTLVGNGMLLRATDRDRDMYVAIDKAVDKLLRQVKKYHGKQIDRTQGQESAVRTRLYEPEPGATTPDIVRTKMISLKPMSPEEATLQMEMLGHDFFVFTNESTDRVSVVYRRRDGGFGLLETSR